MQDKEPAAVTALVVADPRRRTAAPLEFTPEDRALIRRTICPTATEDEFSSLMKIAALKRLNPLLQQIHFVKRNQQINGKWIERWSAQIGIDGLRMKAEETGLYDGQDEPEFIYDEEKRLTCCKVRVYRKGCARAFVGVAFFSEYAQFKSGGGLTQMWHDKPHVMLSKCAEALGMRKAFPDLGDLYVPEEMDRDDQPATPEKMVLDAEFVEEPAEAPLSPLDRLIAICDGALKGSELAPVWSEGIKMAAGPERDRLLAAYNQAGARIKAAKQRAAEPSPFGDRQPSDDDGGES